MHLLQHLVDVDRVRLGALLFALAARAPFFFADFLAIVELVVKRVVEYVFTLAEGLQSVYIPFFIRHPWPDDDF